MAVPDAPFRSNLVGVKIAKSLHFSSTHRAANVVIDLYDVSVISCNTKKKKNYLTFTLVC